jgi:demethylmenaquinone methyltransferase/2-methoxy-6-polyprenyl-1,4-benzoquinol methylase
MNAGRVRLDEAFTSADSKSRYVRTLFATIADRYDLITVLLSFGLDRRWKHRAVRLAAPRQGQRALDLACGTGDIAFEVASHGASVVGLDITHRMLQLASARQARLRAAGARTPPPPFRPPAFVAADMCALPLGNDEFDLVTTGYGLRNVPDLDAAVREISRVLKPGGVLVSLDFNRPSNGLVRAVYLGYLALVGGALGWVLHRDADTYRYIPASIRRYPGAAAVAARMEAQGFSRAEWRPVLGGLMAIHVARK